MESQTTEAVGGEPVRQFAVFAENKVGRLNELIGLLGSHRIHVLAMTTQDTTDGAIVRIIVDDPDQAQLLFRKYGYAYSRSTLIAVELIQVNDLRRVLAALMEAEINIHYLYPFIFRPNERSALAICVEDNDLAISILSCRQLRVLNQDDISR